MAPKHSSVMIDPLGGSRLKQKRALEYLGILKKEIERFNESEPYSAAEVYNPDTGAYRLLINKVTPPLPHWPIIIGDILHNLRSSLDHIVWQLAIVNGNTPPTFPLPKGSPWKNLQFPIFLNKQEFQKSAPRYLWGVGDAARRFIEQIQPFDSPDHPLWWLAELSNIDKHRTLALTSAYLERVNLTRPRGVRFWTAHFVHGGGFLDDKTEVAHLTLVPPLKPPMNMGGVQIMIVFAQGMPAEGRGVIGALGRMGVEANKILKRCRVWLRPRS